MAGRERAPTHPALTDESTGLANRLHFELVYGYLFAGADRGVPLTMMMVSAGAQDDAMLRVLGERMQRVTRASDLVAHLGDGRFVVLLLGSNLSGARIAADRVETSLLEAEASRVSIGLAAFQPEMKASADLIAAADEALRKAESAGGGLEMVAG